MSDIRELDVRQMPPAKRHPQIFETFDALSAEESFVLVNDHDPKPLLYQFQAERAGRFDWSVLEAGPERFRVEIRRRGSDGPRSVTEFLEEDHRHIDAVFPEVERLMAASAFPESADRFEEGACGLLHHIEAEERLLFPAFEQATGIHNGPTSVMRAEHAEIRRIIDAVRAALGQPDADAAKTALGRLVELLATHNAKEEQILYPMTDRVIGGAGERAELIRRMQAV
ncbi:MAG: DUF2249 domain-containing protein [Acidobacteria bacterium]|nr:DUF2249 domain-containing protein [Acidobacteriota bacterium]